MDWQHAPGVVVVDRNQGGMALLPASEAVVPGAVSGDEYGLGDLEELVSGDVNQNVTTLYPSMGLRAVLLSWT